MEDKNSINCFSNTIDLTYIAASPSNAQGIQRKRSYNSFLFNIIFSLFFKLNHKITYRNNIIQVLKNNTWIIFMNYKKLYFNIIRNRRKNPLPVDEYGEVHHIKPRSFGGLDTPNNLIRLSAREHFIVHFLLYKIYKYRSENIFPKSKCELERYKKMAFAFNFMVNIKSKSQKRLNKNINNRVYEQLRKAVSEQLTKYPHEFVKKMFDFYIQNNLRPKTMYLLNQHFDINITYLTFKKLLNRHQLKISNHKESLYFKQKYSRKMVEEMFDFYISNNLYPKTINVLNEKFNTNFTYDTIQQLFSKYKLKISEHRNVIFAYGRPRKIEMKELFDFINYRNNLFK